MALFNPTAVKSCFPRQSRQSSLFEVDESHLGGKGRVQPWQDKWNMDVHLNVSYVKCFTRRKVLTTKYSCGYLSKSRLRHLLLACMALVFTLLISGVDGTAHAAVRTQSQASSLPAPVGCASCWHPALNTSWQWQLTGTVDQTFDVTMYDIDMFDNTASVVQSLHNAGRKVICYVDAGTWESWRPDANDTNLFPASVKGNDVSKGDSTGGTWVGEKWLDIRNPVIYPAMQARMDQCQAKGFDGIEFDNVDGYANDTGFPLTASDQLSYNVFLANEAHKRGLSVALKNDLDQVTTLLPYFDWALNEECFDYQECDSLTPFIKAGKAVMQVEYNLSTSSFCPQANKMNFNSLRKHEDPVDAWREACR